MAEAPGRNLTPLQFLGDTETETTPLEKLKGLAKLLERRTAATVHWYLDRKKWPRRLSQWVRMSAIILAVLGGLTPLATSAQIVDGAKWNQYGYVFIALAGAILLTDRYFGFSSSWMRFMTVQMGLQRALEKFQLSWAVWQIQVGNQNTTAGASSLSSDQINSAVTLLSNFQSEVGTLVDQEFQTWVAEFKEQLATLQAAISKDKEDERPGNIVVSIGSKTPLKGPRQLYLDNRFANQTANSSALLTGISPGIHLLTVRATSDSGATLESTQSVTVIAGQTAQADVTIADERQPQTA